jgi:DNA-binding ferritin-like protein
MDKCIKVACIYISTLKAIYIINQQNHWLSKGTSFYSSHLLFQRIYEKAQENLDLAAEKFIGLFGEEVVNYTMQAEFLKKILLRYSNLSFFEQSLKIEEDFIKFSKQAYDCFEKEGKLSLGLDDMIMAIASDREESVYLLKQSTKN